MANGICRGVCQGRAGILTRPCGGVRSQDKEKSAEPIPQDTARRPFLRTTERSRGLRDGQLVFGGKLCPAVLHTVFLVSTAPTTRQRPTLSSTSCCRNSLSQNSRFCS